MVGIISQRDLFHSGLVQALGYGTRAQRKALDMVVVKDAMTVEVRTIAPDALLSTAAAVMLKRKVGCLVVMENQNHRHSHRERLRERLAISQGIVGFTAGSSPSP